MGRFVGAKVAQLSAILTCWLCSGAWADTLTPDPTVARISDFGGVGLMQTPNARFGADGEFSFGINRVEPLRRYILTLQALPFLEATLRYTDIRNAPYSLSPEFSGDQTYKDRGLDLKLRLLDEQKYLPQLAVGLRDLGGTGLFASEYFVVSKRLSAFDLTFGAAWGTLGSRGTIRNPLTYISDRFYTREDSGIGNFSTSLFSGETIGLFGGASYATPLDGLRLNVEYDPTDYSSGKLKPLETKSQFNISADYAVTPLLDASIGLERGNTLMWRATLHTNFNTPSLLPDFAPPPVAVLPDPPAEEIFSQDRAQARLPNSTAVGSWEDAVFVLADNAELEILSIELNGNTLSVAVEKRGFAMADADDFRQVAEAIGGVVAAHAAGISAVVVTGLEVGRSWVKVEVPVKPRPAQDQNSADRSTPVDPQLQTTLARVLGEQRISLVALRVQEPTIELIVARQHYRAPERALGRILRAVISVTPAQYQDIRVIFSENGLTTQEISVVRANFVATALGEQSKDELARQISRSETPAPIGAADFDYAGSYPQYSFSVSPKTRQSLGRPEQFVTYQIYAEASLEVALSASLSLTATAGQDIVNNFDNLHSTSDSIIPHVRSDIAQYLDKGATGISNIRADYLFNIAPRLYGRVSGGLLEDMFAGVNGEVLYAPADSDFAFGVDIARVQQREFDRLFSLRDYQTTTGHATLYYKPAFWDGVTIQVPVGRYLAGDVGATFDISREFTSGMVVGGFVTKTDLSAEEFGEGEFDKGVYISIPLDQILPTTQRSRYGILYRPLTRDGGQRLGTTKKLYDSVAEDQGKNFDSLKDILR
jgi:hypothetical protein